MNLTIDVEFGQDEQEQIHEFVSEFVALPTAILGRHHPIPLAFFSLIWQ